MCVAQCVFEVVSGSVIVCDVVVCDSVFVCYISVYCYGFQDQ